MTIHSTHHQINPVTTARSAGFDDGYGGYGRDVSYQRYLSQTNLIEAVQAYESGYAAGLGRRQEHDDRAAAEMYQLQALKPSRRAAGRSGTRKSGGAR